MPQVHTWRELLGQLIDSPNARRHLAIELGVNPITVMRWARGECDPRPYHLQRLVALLPHQRSNLLDLIEKEFPSVTFTLRNRPQEIVLLEIPTEFYSRVLHTLAITPPILLFQSLCDLILLQLLGHLDPERMGLAAIVATCMPPSREGHVHSLREHVGRGASFWEGMSERRALLLGAESLAGYAVTAGHVVVNPPWSEGVGQLTGSGSEWERSAAAAPILRKGQIAGSLLLSSAEMDYFHPNRLSLVEQYAELLGLAFESDAYYDISCINLWIMPPAPLQSLTFDQFRDRVTAVMIQSMQQKHSLTLAQAELLVWQQYEEEFFSQLSGKLA